MTDPEKLIAEFTRAAEAEGKNLKNPMRVILLDEVLKSGWTPSRE